jgi:hypothetical protein
VDPQVPPEDLRSQALPYLNIASWQKAYAQARRQNRSRIARLSSLLYGGNQQSSLRVVAVGGQLGGGAKGMLVRSLIVMGMASLLGALFALSIPLHLNSVDRGGVPIPCGNGLHPRYEVAREQDALNLDQHLNRGPEFVASDYADQCAALQSRRWSIASPVGAAGIVMTLFAIGLGVHSRRDVSQPESPVTPEAGRHRIDGNQSPLPLKAIVVQHHSPISDDAAAHLAWSGLSRVPN